LYFIKTIMSDDEEYNNYAHDDLREHLYDNAKMKEMIATNDDEEQVGAMIVLRLLKHISTKIGEHVITHYNQNKEDYNLPEQSELIRHLISLGLSKEEKLALERLTETVGEKDDKDSEGFSSGYATFDEKQVQMEKDDTKDVTKVDKYKRKSGEDSDVTQKKVEQVEEEEEFEEKKSQKDSNLKKKEINESKSPGKKAKSTTSKSPGKKAKSTTSKSPGKKAKSKTSSEKAKSTTSKSPGKKAKSKTSGKKAKSTTSKSPGTTSKSPGKKAKSTTSVKK
jgi:hypothetical protein